MRIIGNQFVFWIFVGSMIAALAIVIWRDCVKASACEARGGVYVAHHCLAVKELP